MVTGFAYGDGFAGLTNDTFPPNLYVRGDEFTDQSLRMVPEPRGNRLVRFERRSNGVWNNTGIEVSGNSLNVGQDLVISAAGRFIDATAVTPGQNSLVPHHDFLDSGSDTQPQTAIVGPLLIEVPVVTDDSFDFTGTEFTSGVPSTVDLLITRGYFRIGSIGATAPVTVSFHRGDKNGPIFFQLIIPLADVSTPNTQFEIPSQDSFQILAGEPITGVFSSEETFSMRGDSLGNLFFSADFRLFVEEEILTESLVLANDLSVAFSNNGSLARHNHDFS